MRGSMSDSIDLPEWAKTMWEEMNSPELKGIQAITSGPLLERRTGMRRDDFVEIMLDVRALSKDAEPWVRGRLVSSGKTSLEVVCEDGLTHFVAREMVVRVILIAHTRPAYIDDTELLAFERDDTKRRSKLHEKVEKEEGRDDNHLWG